MRDIILDKFITMMSKTPFEWGVCDCALFVADWCVVYGGFDPAESYRGRYKTEIGAKRQLLKKDKSMANALDLFMQRIKPNFAQKGDVCCADLDDGLTMGIVAGRGNVWFKTDKEGMILIKITPKIVWRVR